MLKWIFITVVLVAAAALGFFAFNNYIYQEKQAEAEPPPIIVEDFEGEADPSRMTLGMTEWRWVEALYNDGREVEPAQFGTFTLTFGEDGRFSATTDCNSMTGSYAAQGSLLTFSDIASTKKFCQGSQEREFAQILSNTASYFFTSRGELILEIKFDSGTATFR